MHLFVRTVGVGGKELNLPRRLYGRGRCEQDAVAVGNQVLTNIRARQLLYIVAGVGAVVPWAQCALAQDVPSPEQTPANAMKFLQRVIGSGSSIEYFNGNSETEAVTTRKGDYQHTTRIGGNPVTGTRVVSPCKLRVDTKDFVDQKVVSGSETTEVTYIDADDGLDLDFTKLGEAVEHEGGVFLSVPGSPWVSYRLRVEGVGMTARVAYAVEFLRLSCDKNAGFGF